MSAVAQSRRLAAIRICGYRGFPNPQTIWLAPHDQEGNLRGKGRNLLLYGENGSGKSSLGKALRDFLDIRPGACAFDDFRFRYSEPPRVNRGISLIFDDPAIDPLEWNPTSRDTAHRDFTDMARSRGWLDYRAIWRVSEVRYGDSVNIFDALVDEVLPGCLPSTGGSKTFGQLWGEIMAIVREQPIKNNEGRGKVWEVERLINTFNTWLESFVPKLQDHGNELLKEFVPWTSMKLVWKQGAKYASSRKAGNKFSGGIVSLQMLDRKGEPLTAPSEFLNEARMTAIGLCLYLAGLSQSIPARRTDGSTYPRLLIFDDILLSLDMAHRKPLLKLLKKASFRDWQIILLTHDRAWYEIAGQQLDDWAKCELFVERVGDYDQPLLRKDQDHLMWAIDFLIAGHIKAAAVHTRTKFEEVLKAACFELGLSVKYHPDPRKIPASDYWNAVAAAKWDDIPSVECAPDSRGKLRWWQPPPTETPVVPNDLKKEITHALSWVMNPLSHSQCVARYRSEIEDAIFAVNDLAEAIRRAILMRKAAPVMLREMLLGILVARKSVIGNAPPSAS